MSDEIAKREAASTQEREASRGGPAEDASVERSHTSAFLVCQPIASGETEAVRDRIAERRSGDGFDAERLLPDGGAVTVSLFLIDRDGTGAALVWYVEVEDRDRSRTDPIETLVRRSPLYDEEFEALLAGEARRYDDSERVVHAHNPERPGRSETADVVLVRVGIEPGVPTLVARLGAGLIDLVKGTWVERKLESSSQDVIEDERMWTETLFLDEVDGDYGVLWYMEADDMEQVMEVYETTDNRVARWSEVVLDYLFEEPMRALGDPMGASEYELLVHETTPIRR